MPRLISLLGRQRKLTGPERDRLATNALRMHRDLLADAAAEYLPKLTFSP